MRSRVASRRSRSSVRSRCTRAAASSDATVPPAVLVVGQGPQRLLGARGQGGVRVEVEEAVVVDRRRHLRLHLGERGGPAGAGSLAVQGGADEVGDLGLVGDVEPRDAERLQPGHQVGGGGHRVGLHVLVAEVEPGQPGRGVERASGVELPERQARVHREAAAGLDRLGDLQGVAGDVDADRDLEDRSEQGEQQAQPGLLHHPWPVVVELGDDAAPRLELLGPHRRLDGPEVEVGHPPPVVPAAPQQRVAHGTDVAPLPEPLGVLLVRLRRVVVGAEVRAREVQQPGDRRGPGAMHPEDDQLHGARSYRGGDGGLGGPGGRGRPSRHPPPSGVAGAAPEPSGAATVMPPSGSTQKVI